MTQPPPRTARVVLAGEGERVLGALPAVPVATPWWHEAAPVVDAVRTAFGLEVAVLRLLDTERAEPHGGAVTYVGQLSGGGSDVAAAAPLERWEVPLGDDDRRMPWARWGGPDADLAWAASAVRRLGRAPAAVPATQVRSWHLSSLWRIPLEDGGAAWLKCVPPFFAHEGRLLAALAASGAAVPRLLDQDGPRLLLADVAGRDLHVVDAATAHRLVRQLVAIQVGWAGRVDELEALGATDFRAASLARAIRETVRVWGGSLTADERAALDRFVAGLEVRFAAVEACAIPDTLVHGDFHPANARLDSAGLVLLDWGDSGIGHPLLDQPAFLERVPPRWAPELRATWSAAWRDAVPGSEPARAADLLEPVAAARQAVILDRFVSSIEPAEAVYHRADIVRWLRHVVAILGENPGP